MVRSQEGAFFKLTIEGYYNGAGSPAYPTLHWAPIASPDGPIVERAPDAGVDSVTGAAKP